MTKDLKYFLVFIAASELITNYVILFVNLYIWEANQSITDLAMFNLSQFLAWAFAYSFGVYLYSKTTLKIVMQFSTIFSILLFYFMTNLSLTNTLTWIVVIGVCYGLMKGIFSSGKTLTVSFLGSGSSHIRFFQTNDLISRGMAIVAPLIFAWIIVSFGYRISFVVMIVLSVIVFLLSHFLPNIKFPKTEPVYNRRIFRFKEVFPTKEHRILPLSYLTGASFSEFQTIFLLFFTFTITENKWAIACLSIFYAILTFANMHLYRKLAHVRDETWLLMGITIAMLGFALSPFLQDWWLLIPNTLLVLGNFYYRTTYYAQHYQMIDSFSFIHKTRILVWRELLLVLSRIILLVALISLYSLTSFGFWIVTGYAVTSAFFVPFLHKKFHLKQTI